MFVLEEMRARHEEAKQAGVTLFNEVGLDPGIDHMLIMQAIAYASDEGRNAVGSLYSLAFAASLQASAEMAAIAGSYPTAVGCFLPSKAPR